MPQGLRKVVRTHEPYKLVDTLVVGAFIEARSCERFEALVPHLDEELGKFYFGLLKSEARHFQGYLKLAYQYGDERDVDQAIERVRAAERELIESPDTEMRFHSGIPPVTRGYLRWFECLAVRCARSPVVSGCALAS